MAFRFSWYGGRQPRISLGTYLALSLKQARQLRDEARALVAGAATAPEPEASCCQLFRNNALRRMGYEDQLTGAWNESHAQAVFVPD